MAIWSSKFINSLMQHGKKSTAERIVYAALDRIALRWRSR